VSLAAAPSSGPTSALDLTDPAFVADPYRELARLRAGGPLVRHIPTGMLLATTHAAVTQTLRHRRLGRLWRDREPAQAYEPFNTLHRNQMMENEPPAHTRLRRLVAGAFARGHVERMRPRVEEIADQLLDELQDETDGGGADGGGEVDLIARYAEPLPVAVIADLLGVPAGDRPALRDWSQAIVRMYEYGRTADVEAAAVRASTDFAAYVRDLVGHRRRRPGDDLLTDLLASTVAGRDGGTRLSEDELVASVVLLLNAGHEASVNAFGNGIVALLGARDQLARLTSGEVPAAVAVEELLRHDAPLQLFERTATADLELAGVPVPAGDKVAALLGSANRDAAVFADPDRFDIGRDPNPQVGFGAGVHFCLGAPLARMELAIAVDRLLGRWPAPTLVRPPVRRPTFVLRGYREIRVDLGRAR
jgi:cytochrome P450